MIDFQHIVNIPKPDISTFPGAPVFGYHYYSPLKEILTYYIRAENHPSGRLVHECLNNDPRAKELVENNHLIYTGGSMGSLDMGVLVAWVLWAINQYGHETAAANLEKFLDADRTTVLITLWVIGIESKEIINLTNGVQIIPVTKMPDSEEKEKYSSYWSATFLRHATPRMAITCKCEIRKAFTQKEARRWMEEKFQEGTEAYKETKKITKAFQELEKISYLLNSISGVSCIPFFSTSYYLPGMPMGIFGGGGGGGPCYDVLGMSCSKIDSGIAEEINHLLKAFDLLDDKDKRKVYKALSRLRQAKREENIEDKILDLCIALEILLKGDDDRTQPSLSFSMKGSWFIGDDFNQRKIVFNQLKNIYKYRNKVAHGNSLTSTPGDLAKIRSELPQYFGLSEKIIQNFIYNPSVNWDNLLLGR